jgi:hypothetical protein
MPSGLGGAHIDRLDQLHRFGVEHRDRFATREAVARFGTDRRAISADTLNLTDRFERVEIEDR